MDNQFDESSLPWGRVVSFLDLPSVLSCRLASSGIAVRITEEAFPADCSRWLGAALKDRNLHIIPGIVDLHWLEARQENLNILFERPQQPGTTTIAFDTLLRCLRVCQAMPAKAAVAFSGKYGRHVLPLEPNTYEMIKILPCGRGRKNCETCCVAIPRQKRSRANSKLDTVLQIAVGNKEVLKLNEYHVTKCVPNLPRDLVCPLCRVTDRRTLILTEMSYPVPNEALYGRLTFTPLLPEEEEEPAKKRCKTEDSGNTFPPLQSDRFLPGRQNANSRRRNSTSDDDEDDEVKYFKHALAIHCSACREFGLLGPAGLCSGKTGICCGKDTIQEQCRVSIGGILSRTTCRKRHCLSAPICVHCSRVDQEKGLCPQCIVSDEVDRLRDESSDWAGLPYDLFDDSDHSDHSSYGHGSWY